MIPRRNGRPQPIAERAARALLTPERLAGAARLLGHMLGLPGMANVLARRGIDSSQLQATVRQTAHPHVMRQLMEHVGEHQARTPTYHAPAQQTHRYTPEARVGMRRGGEHAPGAPSPVQQHPVGHTERGKRGGVFTVNAQGKKIYKKR